MLDTSDLLMGYDKNLSRDNFKHPKLQGSSIAFNNNLDGLRLSEIPKDVVLLFEADSGWNLTGGAELLKKSHLNRDRVDVLFVNKDIRAYWVEYGGTKNLNLTYQPLRWKP
jgi:hypothetical protein